MTRSIIIADDVLLYPDELRKVALAMPYKTITHGGIDYPGVNVDGRLMKVFMDIVCPEIASLVGFSVVPKLSFLRLSVADHKPTVYIHADGSEEGKWAAILYLTPNEHCVGGTAFWTHKETGWNELAPENRHGFFNKMLSDGKDESLWTQNTIIPMRYNRLVVFKGNQFHSRYPEFYPSETDDKGRLTWVVFFDPQQE